MSTRCPTGLTKRVGFFIALCALSACTTESEKAEKRLATLEKSGASRSEICEAARKVSFEYYNEGNEQRGEIAKLYAVSVCP